MLVIVWPQMILMCALHVISGTWRSEVQVATAPNTCSYTIHNLAILRLMKQYYRIIL